MIVISHEDEPGLDQAVNPELIERVDVAASPKQAFIGQKELTSADADYAGRESGRRNREGDPKLRAYAPGQEQAEQQRSANSVGGTVSAIAVEWQTRVLIRSDRKRISPPSRWSRGCDAAFRPFGDKPVNNFPSDQEPGLAALDNSSGQVAETRPSEAHMNIQQDFGNWTLDPTSRVLEHNGQPAYQIDLDRISSAAGVLDWIFQLEEKAWVKDDEIADFVRAIRYLFGRGFCGSGRNDPIDIKAVLRDRFGLP